MMNKFKELVSLVSLEDPDIIALSETFLRPDIPNSLYDIEGYQIINRVDGSDTQGGLCRGLIIYCKEELNAIKYENRALNNVIQAAGIQFCSDKKYKTTTTLVLVYRPPWNAFSPDDGNNTAKLCSAIASLPKDLILVGDFNFPSTQWDRLYSPQAGEKVFIDLIKDKFLHQLVDFPTHRQGNCLDLIFTDTPDNINNIQDLGPLGDSDHTVIQLEFTGNQGAKDCLKTIPDWSKLDLNGIKTRLNINWSDRFNGKNGDEMWDCFKSILDNAISECLPMKTLKTRPEQRWMTSKIKSLLRMKRLAYRNKDHNQYKALVKQVKYAVRRAKKNYEKKLSNERVPKPKAFFGYLKRITKARDTVGPLRNDKNEIISDDSLMADCLNSFFSSVFTREDTSNIPEPESFFTADSDEVLTNIQFSMKAVEEKLHNLKKDSSPGPNSHWPKILNGAKMELSRPLSLLFTECMRTNICPQDWKLSNLIPLYKKKGSKSAATNYRPVALTSVVCKIMESCIKDEIVKHFNFHDVIRSSQHGFQRGRSTLTNLLEHLETLTKNVDSGNAVDVLYLDFSKAFDRLPHQRLLKKLEGLGVRGKVLAWISNWLQNRKQRVIVRGKKSAWMSVISGVPQGSVLGPLLFIAFINDLETVLEGLQCTVSKFADDTKIQKIVNTPQEQEQMQQVIDSLVKWCSDWGMSWNAKKCSVMHYGTSNPHHQYKMDGIDLASVTSERDIGVIIESNMKPSLQCANAARKANALLGMLTRGLSYRTKSTFLKLYVLYIRPHLENCQVAWAPWQVGERKLLEDVQRRAFRQVSDFKSKTYALQLQEAGLMSIDRRRQRADLIQMFRVLSGTDNVDPSHWFTLAAREEDLISTRASTGFNNVKHQKARRESRSNFWSLRVTQPWNSLPDWVKQSPTVFAFKRNLDEHLNSQPEQL